MEDRDLVGEQLAEIELRAEYLSVVRLADEQPDAWAWFNRQLRESNEEVGRLREENVWLKWLYYDRVKEWLDAEQIEIYAPWLIAEWKNHHPVKCRWFAFRRKIARLVWPW
ncbi:MAG: hypothetical protein KKF41_08575 [Actinobacteria bacterium]|nr:hypothetical protein [Actinomycetota bacterium]MBU1942896.1 hypothetical protein [Actinomycetota bacterium]MBU2687628.1 hypothetical protein [Actinomycetota bacterium]